MNATTALSNLKYALPPVLIPFVKDEKEQFGQGNSMGDVISSLLNLAIMFYAGYLSWECNTKLGKSVPLKVMFALFAALFGLFYLLMYYLFASELCARLPEVPPVYRP
jgi:hydrogenase-4 membrane subunit HyfE